MDVDFEIEDNYAINYNGRHVDLHNNFDFVCYTYDIITRQLKLIWTKSLGNWISENELKGLELIHSNVHYISITYNYTNEYPEDDKCLGEISYLPSSERDINDEFTSQAKPQEGDDILYVFESGYFIRVGCGKIEIIVK